MGISTGNNQLDYGLDWLCNKSERVLDFGCGDGELLHQCAERGTKIHIGIDISPLLITKAQRRPDRSRQKKYYLRCGGIGEFRTLLNSSVDAVILSNILELLPPEDGRRVLSEVFRVLIKDGKALIKLCGHMTPEQIAAPYQADVKWNLTTEEWQAVLDKDFIVKEYKDVYHKDHDLHERMFLLFKPGDAHIK